MGSAVHERLVIRGPVGRLDGSIEHRTHRSISELVRRMDKYSSLESGELAERGARVVPPWRARAARLTGTALDSVGSVVSSTEIELDRGCPCGGRSGRTILRASRYCLFGQAFAELDYRLVRCRRCHLVRTVPQPPDDAEHEVFSDPDFLTTYLEREALFERFLAPVVDEVIRVVPPPGTLVDIGANTGTLVRIANAAGYAATGLEPNEAGATFAQGRGLDVRAQSLAEAGFERGSIDAITMSAVAEHLLDPDAVFAECHRVLRPGGALIVANSPNLRSLAFLLERDAWYGLQPQGHPWQFTPAALRELLERNGFRLVAQRTFGMHRDFGRNRKQRLKRAALRTAEAIGFGDAVTLAAIRA